MPSKTPPLSERDKDIIFLFISKGMPRRIAIKFFARYFGKKEVSIQKVLE